MSHERGFVWSSEGYSEWGKQETEEEKYSEEWKTEGWQEINEIYSKENLLRNGNNLGKTAKV